MPSASLRRGETRHRPSSGSMLTATARSMSTFTATCRPTPCTRSTSNWMAMTEATNDASSVSDGSSSAQTGSAAEIRLLLVDDDDGFRESLGLNLVDESFAVTSFSNGPDALRYVDEGGSADVLLLDWRMPGMDGLEVLRQLRKRGIDLPVIFLTALSDDIYEEAALEGGAVDFIDKSRRLSILLKRLDLIAEGTRPVPEGDSRPQDDTLRLGPLELRFD